MRQTLPRNRKLLKPESSFWRHSANALAAVLFLLALLDWRTGNGLGLILFYSSAVYAAALAVYCGEKEYERWHGYHRAEGGGEAYVLAWTLLLAGLFFFGSRSGLPYSIPPELVADYAIVIVFFAITEKSKISHKEKPRSKSSFTK